MKALINDWNMHSRNGMKLDALHLSTFNEYIRPIVQERTIKYTVHVSKVI